MKRSIVIDNPAEDVPRSFAAVGKACGGRFVLVMRTADDAHVLILTKGKDTRIWSSEAAGFPRVPQMPTTSSTERDANAVARALAKVSKGQGPITFRGTWRGTIECDEHGGPKIVLTRRVSAYVTVLVTNSKTRWAWLVKREGQWFKGPAESKGEKPRLGEALMAALQASVAAASEACGIRDTSRRAALDQEYAKEKPVKVPQTKADPTAKLKDPKEPKAKASKAAPAPKAAPASKADRDVPTGVPGVVYDSSVGGYRPGDYATYRGDDGQVVTVAPSKGKVKWRRLATGEDKWLSPEDIRPGEPVTRPPSKVIVKGVGDATSSKKDKQLMALFQNAMAEALA